MKKIFFSNFKISLFTFFIIICFIILWEILSAFNLINAFLFSSPYKIYQCFISTWKNNNLITHINISFLEIFCSILLSSILGIIISLILYIYPLINKIFNPLLVSLNAIPKSATGIIFIIWFGTSFKGIIAVSVSFSLIITIISLLNYYQNINKDLLKLIKLLHGNKYQLITKIILPASIDNIFKVIKVNVGLSFVGIIIGELLVSQKGIGYLILYGGQVFKMDLVMMGIVILGLSSLLFSSFIDLIHFIMIKIIYYQH